jgi:hypothetical protein
VLVHGSGAAVELEAQRRGEISGVAITPPLPTALNANK